MPFGFSHFPPGDTASLDQFNAYFNSKALANNAEVVLLWSLAGDLEVLVTQPLAGPQDYAQVCVRGLGLCGAPWRWTCKRWSLCRAAVATGVRTYRRGRHETLRLGLRHTRFPGTKSSSQAVLVMWSVAPPPCPGRAGAPCTQCVVLLCLPCNIAVIGQ